MTLPLDHVVILVPELEATIASYRELGFNVQRGGTHADGATHNALVGFADGSYLELIAFLKEAPAHRWWRFQAAGWQGLVDAALLPADTATVVARARAGGVAYEGPFDGGRLRPDGVRLEWQTGTPPSADLPFLCGDRTPREWRVREGEVRVHPNGAAGIAAMTVVVDDVERSARRWAALLGVAPPAPQADAAAGWRRASLALGPTRLDLVQPTHDRGAAAALAQTLAGRGEGVAALDVAAAVAAPVDLPEAATQGARIRLVPAAG